MERRRYCGGSSGAPLNGADRWERARLSWWYLLACSPLLTTVLVGSLLLSWRALRPGSMFVPLDPALVSLRGVAAVLATLCALLLPSALYRDTTAVSRSDPAWKPGPRRYAAVGALAVFVPGHLALALSLVGAVPWTVVALASLLAVLAVDLVSVAYLVRRFRRV